MIKKIIDYVAQNKSSDLALYDMIKVIKAKSTNKDIVKGLVGIETSIAISIKRDKALLDTLKKGLEDYSQQFASEFNLLYEVIGDNFLILRKVTGGYQVLLTSKEGSTINSKTYIKQVEAMLGFIELCKFK